MFRLVYPGPRDSFYNTAIDHVLANRIEKGLSENTIVITEWKPTVSVSHTQSIEKDVDIEACKKRGVECVRRYGPGKSVYLDEGYIVITLLMSYYRPGREVKDFRVRHCKSVIEALKKYKIPALFHQPDNVVIKRDNGNYSTLGNAGQRGFSNSIYLQSAVRYEMNEESFRNIIETMKIDGESLHEHEKDARNALSYVTEFVKKDEVTKDIIASALAESFASSFGGSIDEIKYHFTKEEEKEIEEFARNHTSSREWIQDKPHYSSRGICYFFLDGVNLLPKMKTKSNPPSRLNDLFYH